MPRAYKLTYNAQKGRPPRWRRIYKGVLYQWPAGSGKSDQQAYQDALAQWEAKKREIDAQEDRKEEPAYLKCLTEWEAAQAQAIQHDDEHLARTASLKVVELKARLAQKKLEPLTDADWLRFVLDPGASPTLAAEYGLPPREPAPPHDNRVRAAIWMDKITSKPAAPQGTSVGDFVDRFLEGKAQKVQANQLSVAQLGSLRTFLGEHFAGWLGRATPVEDVDGDVLRRWHAHLLEKIGADKWSEKTCKHAMAAAKAWVRWLWSTGVLRDLPRVLSTEELKISVPDPEIHTFTLEQVKTLLAAATDRTRLYLLLGLNCGYTQRDISDLKPQQVDWEAGRITRKRSKTKTQRKVPIVSYQLWPTTLALLKQEEGADGSDRVLLTENGGPLLSIRDAGGKTVKTDAVRLAFRRLKQKKKIDGGFKLLRKTAASMLADNEQFESLKDLFLGHAAASIADKHYARAAMRRLDQALAWLAGQFGLDT